MIEQTAALCRTVDRGGIAAIECHVPTLVDISLVYDDPANAQEAQFSLPYTVASAALRGGLTLDDLGTAALADTTVRALMSTVRKLADPALSTDAMRSGAPESARVSVRLRDGATHEGFCAVAYGMPSRPLSDGDLAAKYSACLAFGGRDSGADSSCETQLSLGTSGAKRLSGCLEAIWPSGRKDDPIPVLGRLARGLPEQGRLSGARAE